MDDSTTADTPTPEDVLARIAKALQTLAREAEGGMTRASTTETKRLTAELQRRYGR